MATVTGLWWVDTLVLVATLFYLLYKYLNRTSDYFAVRGIPYLRKGFVDQLYDGITKSKQDVFKELYTNFPDQKFYGTFHIGKPNLVIKDPEIVQRIVVKDFSHFHDRGFPVIENDPMSKNLFSAKGIYWRVLRQKLIPTFSTGKLKNMFEQMNKCGDNVVEEVDKLVGSRDPVEARDFVLNFTAEVIGSTAFGLNFGKNSSLQSEFTKNVNNVFSATTTQFIKIFLSVFIPKIAKYIKITQFNEVVTDYIINLTKASIKYRKANKVYRNDYFQLLLNLQEEEESGKSLVPTATDNEEDALINQMDYVPQYSQQDHSKEKLFTDDGITAQSFIFLTAGTESATTTLAFAIYHIAKDPVIQEKLVEEVRTCLAKHGGWTYQAVKDMTYLDQVIQETQRMHLILPIMIRECTIPYTIPGTNITLDKGTIVTVPIGGLQMDPKYYPSPEVFNPDRFEGNNHKPNPTFMPFGDGPRICIAMRFAILEMKVFLAKILAQYSIELNCKTKEPIVYEKKSFVPRPEGGIWVNFKKHT